MPLQTKLILMVFVALASLLVYAVMRVLCTWSEHHIERHDLIVESKRRRFSYLKSIADREAQYDQGNVIIEDDEPDLAIEPAELAQAA